MADVRVFHSGEEMRGTVLESKRAGKSVGLVPTMGALHAGHLSLVEASTRRCDVTVATIFVNPTQFGPSEDFQRYPRTLEQDLELLARRGTDWVFVPPMEEIYPPGFSSYVEPPRVAARWEGASRPGHFRGVATVVLKLFQLIPAQVAFFGQKDYQQTLVIRHMVRDFGVPMEVCVCPIVRESDGLAMSSRNRYLSSEDRLRATAISESLRVADKLVKQGQTDATAIDRAIQEVLTRAQIHVIDYVAIVDGETLDPIAKVQPGTMALVAVRIGSTRLIDNHRFE